MPSSHPFHLLTHGLSQLLGLFVEARELGAQAVESIYLLGIVLIGLVQSVGYRRALHWTLLPKKATLGNCCQPQQAGVS